MNMLCIEIYPVAGRWRQLVHGNIELFSTLDSLQLQGDKKKFVQFVLWLYKLLLHQGPTLVFKQIYRVKNFPFVTSV